MDFWNALDIAAKWHQDLSPLCKRAEIVGSVRRGARNVGDIEILLEPYIPPPLPDLFGAPAIEQPSPLEVELAKLHEKYTFLLDGPREKRIELPQGINLELYIVLPPAQWGVLCVLRTGPKLFSKWSVTQRQKGGALPSYTEVTEGGVHRIGKKDPIPMPDEIDFLNFLELGWIEPGQRRPPVYWIERTQKASGSR